MDTGRTVKRAVLPSPVISDIPAGRAPCEWTAGSDNGGLYVYGALCPRDLFQLFGRTSAGVIARRPSRVLDSLDSEGETRQWKGQHSCVRARVAVEDEAGKRD